MIEIIVKCISTDFLGKNPRRQMLFINKFHKQCILLA